MIRKVSEKILKSLGYLILYSSDFYFKHSKKTYSNKIVFGVDEIANNIHFMRNMFSDDSISVCLAQNKFYLTNTYDYYNPYTNKYLQYLFRSIYGPYLLAKLSSEADIFFYFWYTGFCIDREIDYKFLKQKNKKIICAFVGDDIRSRKKLIEYTKNKRLDTSSHYIDYNIPKNEIRVKRVAFLADKYADIIFNHPKDQISYLKRDTIPFSYIIPEHYFTFNTNKFKNIKTIIIAHAPSNPLGKGTPLVRAAIKKLEVHGYHFKYIELINKPNHEVLNTINKSHIILNQFYAFSPGLFGIEGMARCNAVLMSAEYENMPKNAETAWIKTMYWEVYDNLKYLLDNPNKIQEYAIHGYKFVQDNYREKELKKFYINKFQTLDDKNIFKS